MSQTITLRKPVFVKVKDLKPGQHGYNVYLKVAEVNFEKAKRADGSTLEIADALCGDDTGVVRVRAIGENAPKFKEGRFISIRNGRSEVFKERMRLEVDRWGKVQEETNLDIKEVNKSNNLSETAYEIKVVRVGGGGRGGSGGFRRGGRRGGRGGGNRREEGGFGKEEGGFGGGSRRGESRRGGRRY
jgi:hypothetical protein